MNAPGAEPRLPRIAGRVWALAASLVALGAVGAEEEPQPAPQAGTPPVATFKALSLEELMEMDVTSVSRRPERLTGAASAIQVVTGNDVRRSGATNLPDALRLASNLHVAQTNSREWAISARGMGVPLANKLLVMIDGRTVYSPLFGGVFWDTQDVMLADLDRIEVISGPGATMWGANAVNGVINIQTLSARETQGVHVERIDGTELRSAAAARYGFRIAPELFVRVYGKYFERDGVVDTEGDDIDEGWDRAQGGFRMDWEPGTATRLTLQGDVYDSPIRSYDDERIAMKGGNVLGRWTQTLSETSDISLQAYVDRTHRDIPGSVVDELDTYDVDFQHHFTLDRRNDIVWGLGYRLLENDVDNPPGVGLLPASVTHDLVTGFVQDEIALVVDRLHLTLGTKVEHNDYTGFEVQPSARLVYRPADNHTIWSAVSRAVRTPTRLDADFHVPSTPPFFLGGGPDFESEVLWAYELGYRVQPDDWVSLSLSLFYNDYDEIRSVEPASSPDAVLELGNGLEGEVYGAELAADAQLRAWWRVHAGYTALRTELRAEPGSADTSDGLAEAHDPRYFANLRSSFDLPGRFELDLVWRLVGRIDNQQVPSYQELDVRIGWQASPEIELSVVGQNLLHEHHAESNPPATRNEIERSVYGKAVWRF